MSVNIHQIARDDVALMDQLLRTFGEAFADSSTYTGKKPGEEYLKTLLDSDYFIALAALKENEVVGALAAYELKNLNSKEVKSTFTIWL